MARFLDSFWLNQQERGRSNGLILFRFSRGPWCEPLDTPHDRLITLRCHSNPMAGTVIGYGAMRHGWLILKATALCQRVLRPFVCGWDVCWSGRPLVLTTDLKDFSQVPHFKSFSQLTALFRLSTKKNDASNPSVRLSPSWGRVPFREFSSCPDHLWLVHSE